MKTNYIEQYKKLYEIKESYGQTSIKLYSTIIPYIDEYKAKTILDFGCGKSKLSESIQKNKKLTVYRYDPAIEEYSVLPNDKIDFLICTDVLQHIPLYDLNRVLGQIKKYTDNCFFYIKCTKHKTILPNGEYANCTVHQAKWWKNKLKEFFYVVEKIEVEDKTSVAFITRGIQ